jgi:sigma-E factor negative regulatory protein RseA
MNELNSSPTPSEQIREQLSALMDGELSADETRFLLRRMDSDPALAGTWSRFQLVQSVLKRETFESPASVDFSRAVLAQLDAQPAIRPAYRVLRWAGGSAIAASVALVALTVSRPVHDPVAPAPIVASVVTAAPAPVAVPSAPVDSVPMQPWLQNLLSPNRFDYAQPASFDAPIIYRYDPSSRNTTNGYAVPNGSAPYPMRPSALQAKAPAAAVPAPRH